jgi:hypothetical protein
MGIYYSQNEIQSFFTNTMRRVLIALNVSKGSLGQHNHEYRKFQAYAIRSLADTVSYIHKDKRRRYLYEEEFKKIYDLLFLLMNKMKVFKKIK